MAEYNAVRRVGCNGQVSVYGRDHYVGKNYRGQDIYVFLDPVDREWVFATAAGTQLCRKVAEELTRERDHKIAGEPSSPLSKHRDAQNPVSVFRAKPYVG